MQATCTKSWCGFIMREDRQRQSTSHLLPGGEVTTTANKCVSKTHTPPQTAPQKSKKRPVSPSLGYRPQNFRRPVWDIDDASCQISRRSVNSRRRKPRLNKNTHSKLSIRPILRMEGQQSGLYAVRLGSAKFKENMNLNE